jgi:hypothetical protein
MSIAALKANFDGARRPLPPLKASASTSANCHSDGAGGTVNHSL